MIIEQMSIIQQLVKNVTFFTQKIQVYESAEEFSSTLRQPP